jgi:hypothetical protein
VDFINNELRESRLFRSSHALSKRTAEDIKNITYLYFLALAIMKDEFETAPWTQEYLAKSFRYGKNFTTSRRSDTDLYWCIHVIDNQKHELLDKKFSEENQVELERIFIPKQFMIHWVKRSIKGTSNENDTRRFLMSLEQALKISTSDYISMRRLIVSWPKLNNSQRAVVCTRLRYALNRYARISELYPEFDSFVKSKKYIIKGAVDPESPKSSELSMKEILAAAGLGIAAGLIGSILSIKSTLHDDESYRQRLKSYFKENTTSSSIAGVVMPLGSTIKRGDRKKKSIFVEGYKEATAEFTTASNDKAEVDKVIAQYRELVDRNQVKGDEKNIDWWRKQGWNKFKEFVSSKSTEKSITQVKRSKNEGDSHTIAENATWLIVVPLDKDASCFHGKNTDWCTSKPFQSYFEKYFYKDEVTLIYCLNKKTGDKWAIAGHKKLEGKAEYFDKNDKSLTKEQFDSQTGLKSDDLIKKALGTEIDTKAQINREKYKAAIRKIEKFLNTNPTERNTEIEKLLFYTKSELIMNYMEKIGKRDDYPVQLQTIAVQQNGYAIQYIKNPSEKVQLAAIQKDGMVIQYIENPSEAVQLAAVQQNGYAIQYIENPSEAVQLAAVQQNGYAIQYIENPSEAVQLAAVKQYVWAIQYIKNPTEAVQLAAVKQDIQTIEYIRNPKEAVQLAAVQLNSFAIRYIKNPSEAVQLAAVQKNGRAIQFIKNPSEAVQLAAIKQSGWGVQEDGVAIQFIKNPSELVQLAAVKQSGYAIRHIENPKESVQLAAVQQNGRTIEFIKNPSELVQLAAVKQSGYAIQFIKNPSEAIQLAAVQQDGYAIEFIKNPSAAVRRAADANM